MWSNATLSHLHLYFILDRRASSLVHMQDELVQMSCDAMCMYFMDKKTKIKGSSLPIGYPVSGKQVLLLDEEGQEVGVDEVGEIAVKSRYLALGYWQRPDLTGAAFAPDPQGGEERIYRTGDLGSISADGCLVNLGRNDFQVKIRGYRIEVAEIEMALLKLGGIEEAAVMAQQGATGDPRLVGYILPNRWPAPSTGDKCAGPSPRSCPATWFPRR